MRPNFSPRFISLAVYLLLAALLAGCGSPSPVPTTTPIALPIEPSATQTVPPPPPSQTPQPAIDLQTLRNQDYSLADFRAMLTETGGVIRLQDGVFDHPIQNSAAGVHAQYIDGVQGDLDGDGDPDAAVILAVNSGGSGVFHYLVALINRDQALQQAASTPLGDRVQIKALDIQDGAIHLQELAHAAGDPQCCPTLEKTADYTLLEEQLVPVESAGAVQQAFAAVQALEEGDMPALAALAHPTQGVRFSPYSYVRDEDLVFTPEQIASLKDDPTAYTWGAFDGSGLPIQMTFPEYDQRFIYSSDFAHPDSIGVNRRIGGGNTMDNSLEYYPGSVVVEFYRAPQDPQYGGMDWQSLRLVLLPEGDRWRLVGVIHDEWTT